MLKVFESFAGIGSQRKALARLGIKHEVVGISEWEINSCISYDAIHSGKEIEVPQSKEEIANYLNQFTWSSDGSKPMSKEQLAKKPLDILRKLYVAQKRHNNYGSIVTIKTEDLPNFDLFTYSFPCTDISVAGKQKGLIDDNGNLTRSGLLYEALRIIKDKRPKYLLAENVKNLVGKQFRGDFNKLLGTLEELGYKNYWKILNAKHYGVPQNRERVFVVSIRKDIAHGFEWPKEIDNGLRLKDILQDEVDEKYYLSDKGKAFVTDEYRISKKITQIDGETAICLTAKGNANWTGNFISVEESNSPIRLGNIYGEQFGTGYAGNVWDKNAISPSLMTMQGGNRQPMIIVPEATKKGYAEAEIGDSINLEQPNSKTRRGRVGKGVAQTLTTSCNQAVVEPCVVASRGRYNEEGNVEQHYEINDRGTSNTLTSVQKDNYVLEPIIWDDMNGCIKKDQSTVNTIMTKNCPHYNSRIIESDYRIRKLTPLECIRLMNFDDIDYYHMKEAGISDSQIYKQCGNSIVVACLESIFKSLLLEHGEEKQFNYVKMKTKNGTEYEQIAFSL